MDDLNITNGQPAESPVERAFASAQETAENLPAGSRNVCRTTDAQPETRAAGRCREHGRRHSVPPGAPGS